MSVHFSSQRLDWKTPKAVYQTLDAEFHFDFDPCPPNPTFDGLQVKWGKSNFVNPPYGRELLNWMVKGKAKHTFRNATVVFLIPSRTDTRWWHDVCMEADEIRFIKGRLKFDDQANSAPFPSAIVIFRAKQKGNDLVTNYPDLHGAAVKSAPIAPAGDTKQDMLDELITTIRANKTVYNEELPGHDIVPVFTHQEAKAALRQYFADEMLRIIEQTSNLYIPNIGWINETKDLEDLVERFRGLAS